MILQDYFKGILLEFKGKDVLSDRTVSVNNEIFY